MRTERVEIRAFLVGAHMVVGNGRRRNFIPELGEGSALDGALRRRTVLDMVISLVTTPRPVGLLPFCCDTPRWDLPPTVVRISLSNARDGEQIRRYLYSWYVRYLC